MQLIYSLFIILGSIIEKKHFSIHTNTSSKTLILDLYNCKYCNDTCMVVHSHTHIDCKWRFIPIQTILDKISCLVMETDRDRNLYSKKLQFWPKMTEKPITKIWKVMVKGHDWLFCSIGTSLWDKTLFRSKF